MCGISGFVSNGKKSLKDLKLMTDIIVHRGPDDEGFAVFSDHKSDPLCLGGKDTPSNAYQSDLWYKPTKKISLNSDVRAKVALGHRRLSILDLSSNGHQPMCSEDRDLWIIFNGEIYNFIELREKLSHKGYHFNSETDTEVILAAYREWGVSCLEHFIGMWAFVIYDNVKEEIFIARDRFGIKPLYYWFDPENNFHFASEIKQFTVCNGWRAKLNKQRAYDYLIYSFTDHTDETMFDGVFALAPGHYFKENINNISPGSDGKIKAIRWYDLASSSSNLNFDRACIEFKKLFKDAVKVHLRSDVPVGSALSGGLDSSAIVCEINNILRSDGKKDIQKTFSSCSKFEKYDEKKWMDIVIEHTDVNAFFTYPNTNNFSDLTSKILWHHDEPYLSQSAYLGYHVFQLAKEENVKVLLNGQGADEYLGGYSQFNKVIYYKLFKELRWKTLYEEIKSSNKANLLNTTFLISYLFIPEKIRNLITKKFSSVSDIKKIIDIEKLGAKNLHPYTTIPNDITSTKGISRLNLFHSPLPKYLRWEDRNSMAHSIEARVPFLDHRLVDFTCNLSPEFLFSKGITKRIMRKGLEEILPAKIANRKDKKGFITPEEHWVKNESSDFFREKIKDSISYSNGIIKNEALNYFDEIVNGDRSFDYTYIRLILFAEWAKIFNVELT